MLLSVVSAKADYVADLARIHIEALGGQVRLAHLVSLHATGYY